MKDITGNPVTYPFPKAPGRGEAIEIADGVLWMRLALAMRPDHLNVYAFDEGDSWSVVDTGLNAPSVRDEWDALLAGPLAGKPVGRIILTHHHPDHVGLAGWFQSEHQAELWATRTSWLFSRMLTLDVQERPAPESLAFWTGAGMDADILAARAASRPFNFADAVAPMPLGFRCIGQGEEIALGGRNWRIETGYGHAPEQATFWGLDHNLVLTADQILPRITPNLGVYATEPGADPVGAWIESCQKLRKIAEEDHFALPGHQLPFYGLPGRLDTLITVQKTALSDLLGFLDAPRRASDCFNVLYRRKIAAGEYGLALVEAVGHLNHLHAAGQVIKTTDSTGTWWWSQAFPHGE